MQTITTSNILQADAKASEFKLQSQIVTPDKEGTDTLYLVKSLAEFKKIIAGFIQPDQCENAIAAIEESKLGKEEKKNRVSLLADKCKEIVDCIQKVASFENITEEYKGFLLEQSARYDDVQGFIITASHPEYGSKVFVSKDFTWSLIKKEAKKWMDSFLTRDDEAIILLSRLTTDDEAIILLSRLTTGQEVWVKNRKGEFRGFDNAIADIIFCDTGELDQVYGLDIALVPERAINPTESVILEFIQSSVSPVSSQQIAEALDLVEIQVSGFGRNLIGFGLISSSMDEEGDIWYSVKSAATEVCKEMEQIAVQVELEHGENAQIQVDELPFGDEDGEIFLTTEQAESIIEEINHSASVLVQTANQLRSCIKLLEVGRGYEALGYKDMSELFKSGLLEKSRSTLQKEWQAHRVEQALGMDTGTLTQDHGMKLFPVLKSKPEKLEEVYQAAIDEAGTESSLNARCIRDAIAQVTPELKPKSKPKSKIVQDGGSRRFDVVLPGMKITIKEDEETISELLKIERPVEEFICEAAIDFVMETMGFNLRSQAIAHLVEREKNKR